MRRLFDLLLLASGIRVSEQKLYEIKGTNFKDACRVQVYRNNMVWKRLYTVMMFGVMCVPTVYSLIGLFEEPSGVAFVDVVLSVLPPVQYLCSVRYFASDHFDQFHTIEEDESIEFDDIVGRPCQCTPNIIAVVSILTSLLYFIGTSFVTMEQLWYMAVCNVVCRLIGSISISINAICLSFVFWKHIKVIDVYVHVFEAQDWRTCEDHYVSVLLRNVVRMKESLHASSELLSFIFSSATTLGALASGTVFYRWSLETFDVFVYLSLALFTISQCIFFYVIYRLSEAKDDIEVLVRSADFADSFLHRGTANNADQRVRETSTTIDWFVISYLLKEQWLDFSVMGLPLHSGAFVKQCVAIVAAVIVISQEQGWLDD